MLSTHPCGNTWEPVPSVHMEEKWRLSLTACGRFVPGRWWLQARWDGGVSRRSWKFCWGPARVVQQRPWAPGKPLGLEAFLELTRLRLCFTHCACMLSVWELGWVCRLLDRSLEACEEKVQLFHQCITRVCCGVGLCPEVGYLLDSLPHQPRVVVGEVM